MEAKAVIFDMDGVIIDSNPLITQAWAAFFSSHGISLTEIQLKQFVFGRTGEDTINAVFERQVPKDLIKSYIEEVGDKVRELYMTEGKMVPGVVDFIRWLASNQIPIGLATSGSPKDVKIVLELAGILPYFHAITDSSQVTNPKPHPETFLITAKKLGVSPDNCCVFEDSISGITAARSAGMSVIGMATTHRSDELKPLVEDILIDFTNLSSSFIKMLTGKSFPKFSPNL